MVKVWGRRAISYFGDNINLYIHDGNKYKRFLKKLNMQLHVAQLYHC